MNNVSRDEGEHKNNIISQGTQDIKTSTKREDEKKGMQIERRFSSFMDVDQTKIGITLDTYSMYSKGMTKEVINHLKTKQAYVGKEEERKFQINVVDKQHHAEIPDQKRIQFTVLQPASNLQKQSQQICVRIYPEYQSSRYNQTEKYGAMLKEVEDVQIQNRFDMIDSEEIFIGLLSETDSQKTDPPQYQASYSLAAATEKFQSYEILYPIDLQYEMECDQTKQFFIEEQGEIFYFYKKIAKSKNIYKGRSELLGQKVVGVLLNSNSSEYQQLIHINSYLQLFKIDKYFNLSFYSLSTKLIQSQYLLEEIDSKINPFGSIYSVQNYYDGCLKKFIKMRSRLQKPLTSEELEVMFLRLLEIGSALETLSIYHSNFKVTKLLLKYCNSCGKFQSETLVLTSLHEIIFIQQNNKYFDFTKHNIEFKLNGYQTPEINNFLPQILIFKQISYSVGLIMLNLLILDIFSTSRFLIGFKKGIQSLQTEDMSQEVKQGIELLLNQDQEKRYNCTQVLQSVFKRKTLTFEELVKDISHNPEDILAQQQYKQTQVLNFDGTQLFSENPTIDPTLIQSSQQEKQTQVFRNED